MRAGILAALIAVPSLAFAQEVQREELFILGWNDACSVAVAHYGYSALAQDPVFARIGALTIAPGQQSAKAAWAADWSGDNTWRSSEADKLRRELAVSHNQAGFPETIQVSHPSSRAVLDDILRSTQTFHLRLNAGWPSPPWRLGQIHYSPLGSCGLFIFVNDRAPKPVYSYVLARLYNPGARITRSHAHSAKSQLLLEAGDLPDALKEAAVAAQMAPLQAPARYHHAVLLCLSGSLAEAEEELVEAITLDARYKSQARTDKNLESLWSSRRFQEITKR